MGWGTRSTEADEEALLRAERAAAAHGLGERTHTQRIGSRITGLGCASLMPALLCLIFGAGTVTGPYGPGAKAAPSASSSWWSPSPWPVSSSRAGSPTGTPAFTCSPGVSS